MKSLPLLLLCALALLGSTLFFHRILIPQDPPITVTFTDSFNAQKRAQEITDRHKLQTESIRTGIIAGYLASQRGIPVDEYLLQVEAQWSDLLTETLEESAP